MLHFKVTTNGSTVDSYTNYFPEENINQGVFINSEVLENGRTLNDIFYIYYWKFNVFKKI